MLFPGRDTLYVHRPAPNDIFGDPTGDPPQEFVCPGFAVAPTASGGKRAAGFESLDDRGDEVEDVFTAYGPNDFVFQATDLVTWNGTMFQVLGRPQSWRSPVASAIGGQVVSLRRSTG